MKESVEKKAVRYLSERRLTVTHVDDFQVTASCRGVDGVYAIRWIPEFLSWECSCQARGKCCHLEAVKMVVTR